MRARARQPTPPLTGPRPYCSASIQEEKNEYGTSPLAGIGAVVPDGRLRPRHARRLHHARCPDRGSRRPAHLGRRRRRRRVDRGLGRLRRARRNRRGLRLGHALRERHRLQGRGQDGQHLRRDGRLDERGRLRSGDGLRRRIAAPDRRRARAADQHRPDQELEHRRRSPQGGTLAHRRGQALRRAVSVGTERADVQHGRLPRGADQLERRLRRTDSAGRQIEQGPHPGLRRSDPHR